MNFDECYAVIAARDPRFDGRFVTAVRTTGIYCRPSCPARTPRRENVEFYPVAAAAHQAGYRACRRCLPEAVPGSSEWNTREDTAARAMRMIADGAVDRIGVAGLAAALGYSSRQLERVMRAELGAGPLALARAHRAQCARQLLVGTGLSMPDVAHAAGFGSLRQFNDTIRDVFGLTPKQIRARARTAERGARCHDASADDDQARDHQIAATIDVALSHRAPADHAGTFRWLAERALDGMEDAGPAHYGRTLRAPGGPAALRVELQPDGTLRARVTVRRIADLGYVLARARRLFDLDADPQGIDAALRREPRLTALVDSVPGIRLPGAVDGAEMLVRAIVGQQISVAAMRTTLSRLTERAGSATGLGHGPALLFPEPEAIIDAGGVPGPESKRRTLLRACQALLSGDIAIHPGVSREELTTQLTALKGIGPWTADYVCLRALGSSDVLVRGDLVLRSAAAAAGFPADERELDRQTAALAPWRSYASIHLWRSAAAAGTRPRADSEVGRAGTTQGRRAAGTPSAAGIAVAGRPDSAAVDRPSAPRRRTAGTRSASRSGTAGTSAAAERPDASYIDTDERRTAR
ncbi:Ada metal-binding domain-containing protein [Sediminivirga luteola]|uniref:DNA-3-methyladenine glycosylase II n=1 Tax=Sediminivirga luteola TaxID=1774748 RepID=A0A8J2U0I2_9MICO|nr:Ada metal-binding domain-containing protein [Sediminivirga luteola]MCI2265374.1 helix-turn-helix domain-containing protein [Sediminivirga luteola]GGA24456.1 putative 3-methyladenine DNA glycosylase AlkA [Sediminivirga luteola]